MEMANAIFNYENTGFTLNVDTRTAITAVIAKIKNLGEAIGKVKANFAYMNAA
jgi:hypothetical protein